MDPIRIALVGVGKIVRDQHAPVIAASPDFELLATASPHSTLDGVAAFKTLGELLQALPQVQAVGVTGVAGVRHAIARKALQAGKAVLLEKPPCTTLSAVEDLRALAEARGTALFASWHSRFAPAVQAARDWLAERPPERIDVVWREDVRRWHPGQDWVWAPGGLGVFDPGINALSILTLVAPGQVVLTGAELSFPEGRQTPIAASLTLAGAWGGTIAAQFDWRETGPQTWELRAEGPAGTLRLYEGGAKLQVDGRPAGPQPAEAAHAEYEGLYRRFAELVRAGACEVDERPLRLAADAFLVGSRRTVEPFEDGA